MLNIVHQFDVFFGLLTPVQWDVWRGWITTLGGLIALIIAVSTYRRNVRLKNEEQARKVYAEIVEVGDGKAGEVIVREKVDVDVHSDSGRWVKQDNGDSVLLIEKPWRHYKHSITNGSEEIIGPVSFTQQYIYPDGRHRMLRKTFMVMKPDKVITIDAIVPGSPTDLPRALFLLTFRDSSGKWWTREATNPIMSAHKADIPTFGLRPRKSLRERLRGDEWEENRR